MVGEWTCRGCGRAAGSALLLSWVCCWGCIVGCACAAKWLWERRRAENNNNNNTAITTDWTLPSFAKARFASPVVYPPVLRVRRASANCLLYYLCIYYVYARCILYTSRHPSHKREQGDMYHSKVQHPDSPPLFYTLPSANKHPSATQEAISRFY